MEERGKPAVGIDLAEFKLHVRFASKTEVTLLFDSPSRRFYLSVIALVLHEMKRLGKITSVPLEAHADQLNLLNETIGDSLGSSENLIPRIYRKWKDALPDLENAPLFKVAGRKKEADGLGRTYRFTEAEKDVWANLFEYKGSEEHVRLRLSIDKLGAGLDDAVIVYEDARNGDAWERFISSLKARLSDSPVYKPTETGPETPEGVMPTGMRWDVVQLLRRRSAVLVTALVVMAGVVSFIAWHMYAPARPGNLASIEKMAFPLPDKPSIAVLPFVNMSDDPKQDYLADGFAEEILNGLSKCPQIVVIAWKSSSIYKGKPVKVQQVAEELGVRNVLEGSLRTTGDTVRITVKLIDALTGQHLFSERYDRELKNILVMQDEITMKVLDAIQVKLTAGEDARLRAKGTTNLEAYLNLMQARQFIQMFNKESLALARRLTEQALALDPHYAVAYATLCKIQMNEVALGVHKNSREALEQAVKLGEKAITLDDSNALAHAMLSMPYAWLKEYDRAIAEAEKAVSLDPNSSYAYHALAAVLTWGDRPQEAIPFFKKCLRLSPIPIDTTTLINMGVAYRQLGQYEEAAAGLKRALQLYGPDHLIAHLHLAATYAMMGREKEARAEAAEVVRIDPTFSMEALAKRLPFKDQKVGDDYMSALRKAGLK